MVLQAVKIWHRHLLGFWGGLRELLLMAEGEAEACTSHGGVRSKRGSGGSVHATHLNNQISRELTIMRKARGKSASMIQSPPPTLGITTQHEIWWGHRTISNSHTIKLTHLRYTIQWIVVYSHSCAITTTI